MSPEERAQLSAVKLDTADGWAFWRFDLEFRLTPFQRSVQVGLPAQTQGSACQQQLCILPALLTVHNVAAST